MEMLSFAGRALRENSFQNLIRKRQQMPVRLEFRFADRFQWRAIRFVLVLGGFHSRLAPEIKNAIVAAIRAFHFARDSVRE